MIKYLGSKRTLIPKILRIIQQLPEVQSVVDLFSGTSRVGHALKGAGYQVFSNDHNAYAATIARCYVESDKEKWETQAQQLIQELEAMHKALPPIDEIPALEDDWDAFSSRFPQYKQSEDPFYFTRNFCIKSLFFQPHNGVRIDFLREEIASRHLPEPLHSIALISLMEAADRVDSTTGLQMAYLKKWAPRAYNTLELRLPTLQSTSLFGSCKAHQMDAKQAAKTLKADLFYLDPPYNQHKYLGNYHIWESLVLWDKPDVYGVACKRMDVRERKSAFNSKPRALQAFSDLLDGIETRYLVVSFNDEGYISRQQMETLLQKHGTVLVLENDFKRYVGAQIGIHNPKGERVGAVTHLRNVEYLYIVARRAEDLKSLL